jgi:hypothetical protein
MVARNILHSFPLPEPSFLNQFNDTNLVTKRILGSANLRGNKFQTYFGFTPLLMPETKGVSGA